ncbi:MAG TPA: SurA N-terminal domain-containing protein, partial [Ideonella sp.]|nr:SurA N-terminal domain-containing protein [Ideonella sp.]
MFDFVRTHTKLLQFMLVLLIFPSFVFFGIQGYSRFTDASNATVAKVGGYDIKQSELDQAHRVQVERMRQQMPGVDIKLFDTPEAKKQTLEGLVRERLLLTAAFKDNMRITDAQLVNALQKMPELAPVRDASGRIDRAAYKAFLAARGLSDQGFEADLQQGLLRQQVMQGVSASTLPGKTATNATIDALLERREVQLQRFDAKDYLAKVNPSDADIEAFYK